MGFEKKGPAPGDGTCPQCGEVGVKLGTCTATGQQHCTTTQCRSDAGVNTKGTGDRKPRKGKQQKTAAAAATAEAAAAAAAYNGASGDEAEPLPTDAALPTAAKGDILTTVLCIYGHRSIDLRKGTPELETKYLVLGHFGGSTDPAYRWVPAVELFALGFPAIAKVEEYLRWAQDEARRWTMLVGSSRPAASDPAAAAPAPATVEAAAAAQVAPPQAAAEAAAGGATDAGSRAGAGGGACAGVGADEAQPAIAPEGAQHASPAPVPVALGPAH